ncbi:MAG: hypothetical protein IT561_21215, partial [Alphaproteobacteria bacterium]|nr:hypothetical protein [Alphaproteobacteria bacterium]
RLAPFADLARDELAPLPARGLSNRHVRLGDRGWIVRIPCGRLHGMNARTTIDYQATSFLRLAPSGSVPSLRAVLWPASDLPRGGLVVREVRGPLAHPVDDLPAIAQSLAAIHALPPPPGATWSPLIALVDPIRHLHSVARGFWRAVPPPALPAATVAAIAEELRWADTMAAAAGRQPRCLVVTDPHHENFVMAASGRAVLVDVEQVYYGLPAVDVAAATLPRALGWHGDFARVPEGGAVLAFERAWLARLPAVIAAAVRPWLRPARRLLWLAQFGDAVTKCLASDDRPGSGIAAMDAGTRERMAAGVRAYAAPDVVARLRAQWLGPGALPDP